MMPVSPLGAASCGHTAQLLTIQHTTSKSPHYLLPSV